MAEDAKASIIVKIKNQAAKSLEQFKQQFSDAINPIEGLGRKAALGLAAVGTAIAGAAAISVREAAKFEQTRVAFVGMLGSAEKADFFLKQLYEFAANTPFEIPQLEEAAKRLTGYGISAGQVIPMLRELGDVSAVVGMDKLPNLITAMGQISAKTVLTGQELLQLTETGLPIIAALAEQTGYSMQSIVGETKDLRISFEDVRAAIAGMSEGGKLAFKAMETQMSTFNGQWSNFKDNLTLTARLLGAPLLEPMKSALSDANKFLGEFRKKLEKDFDGMSKNAEKSSSGIGTSLKKGFGVLWDIIKPSWDKVWAAIKSTWEATVSTFRVGVEFVKAMWRDWGGVITSIAKATWEFVTMRIEQALIIIRGIMQFITGVMTGNWELIKSSVVNTVKALWNNVIETFNAGVQIVISSVNAVINKLNELGGAVGVNIQAVAFNLDGMKFSMESAGAGYQDAFSRMGLATQTQKEAVIDLNDTTSQFAETLTGGGGGGGGGGNVKSAAEDVTDRLGELTEAYGDLGEAVSSAIYDATQKHKESLISLNEDLVSINEEIKKLRGDYDEDELDSKKKLAEQIIDQELHIADIKADIAAKEKDIANEKADTVKTVNLKGREIELRDHNEKLAEMRTELAELQSKLLAEEQAQIIHKDIIKSLDNEIKEVRRRNALTDLERTIEDYKIKESERKADFDKELELLELRKTEIEGNIKLEKDQYLGLRNEIVQRMHDATEKYTTFVTNQKNVTVAAIDEMIKKYQQLASVIRSSGSGSFSKKIPGFANGVTNFSGGLAMVGEQGPELVRLPRGSDVIPNHKLGSGGGSITVNIVNTQVLDKDDVVDKIGDPILKLLKQHFAVV